MDAASSTLRDNRPTKHSGSSGSTGNGAYVRTRSFLQLMLLASAHSLFLFFAFAPVGFWPCAFAAPLPLFLLVRIASHEARVRPWRAGLAAIIGAIPFWAFTEHWIWEVSAAGCPFLILIESFWAGAFVWLAVKTRARWGGLAWVWMLPVLWTGVEFVRGELFGHGYAWGLVAYPLIDSQLLASPATVGGVYLVSLLTCVPAAAALDGWEKRRVVSLGGLAVWVVATVGAYLTLPAIDGGKTVSIAAVQTNLPESNKLGWSPGEQQRDFKRFSALTADAAASNPDMIVWPETMVPAITLDPNSLAELVRKQVYFRIDDPAGPRKLDADEVPRALMELSKRLSATMLVGAEAREGMSVEVRSDGSIELEAKARFNSVYMLESGRLSDTRYDKARLTPFGETMPYISSIPGLQERLLEIGANGMKFNLHEGTRKTVFHVPTRKNAGSEFRCVTPICFEVTVGPYVRELVYEGGARRADVIVNVTNDGWFGSFAPARAQHLQIARWRSLELATPMVRAANTGISCSIDARGQLGVVGPRGVSTPALSEGYLVADVVLSNSTTLYGLWGDVVGWMSVAATGIATLFAGMLGSAQRKKTAAVTQ